MPERATPAAHVFKRLKRSLSYLGLSKRADHPALMLMAMHYSLAMKAFSEMESLTRDDENGVTRKHPLLQVIRDSSEMFKSYAAEFGMTPVSRERITTREAELDPFDAFMKEKEL